MHPTSYESAGVNVGLGERFVERLKGLARRPGHQQLLQGAGGYAAVYPVSGEHCVALTTDGVGTKVLLAHRFQKHHGIGIDLVAMCANDLICVGARPMLFLDYYATGRLELDTGLALIEGIVEGCDQAGMFLAGGETAEMPDVYAHGHYDLAGFAVGQLERAELITGEQIQPGQTVIGIASSGIHSNGLSLARKCFQTDDELMQLLEPTRIYVKPVLQLLLAFPGAVSGICHVTGGGWRNLFRLNQQVGYEISDPLPLLPVFEGLLARGVTPEEGYKTFNMGMGLVLIVTESAQAMVDRLNQSGFPAKIVGEVTDDAGRLKIPHQQIELTQVVA